MNISPLVAFFNPSPFSTHTEFLEVKGPFYTFSHQPGVIAFLLILCALGSLYFVYASFVIKKGAPAPKSPVILGILLALGMASTADSIYHQYQKQSNSSRMAQSTGHPTIAANRSSDAGLLKSLAFLGMVGGSVARRSPQKTRFKSRRSRR